MKLVVTLREKSIFWRIEEMYNVGDKILYPYYGVGTIEEITEKEFLGEKQKYYVVVIPSEQMKVMVPVKKAEEVGLRKVVSSEEVSKILSLLGEKSKKLDKDWSTRYSDCLKKIQGSDIFAIAEVVRDLLWKREQNKLSWMEKGLLKRGIRILSGEIACARNIKEREARRLIFKCWRERFNKRKAS